MIAIIRREQKGISIKEIRTFKRKGIKYILFVIHAMIKRLDVEWLEDDIRI